MKIFRRNTVFYFLVLLLGLTCTSFLDADFKNCYIKDRTKHETNQKLLEAILEQELASDPSKDPSCQARNLMARITQIGSALLEHGFATEAYEMPELDCNSIVTFNCFTLWEGDNNPSGSIPLTLFVYVWPSEEVALKYNPRLQNHYYGSNIHSHPITCAFTVLQGDLVQNNYQPIPSHPDSQAVQLTCQELFRKGTGDIDDLKQLFIHQLYNQGHCSRVSLSLHAYGLPSKEKVMNCFRETSLQCSYSLVTN